MSDSILFYINGTPYRRGGASVFQTLTAFLRDELRLTGTKVVCGEGACGACTVLAGTPHGALLQYQTLNACLLPLYQVAGCHVVTVEGIAGSNTLSVVQEALVAGHGAQCGFCTPGMVMTLTGFCESAHSQDGLPDALCGNLCRCTGYLPILESARAINITEYQPLAKLYPEEEIAGCLAAHRREAVQIEAGGRRLFLPTTMEEGAGWLRDYPDAVIVGGGTELNVQWAHSGEMPQVVVSLAFVTAQAQVTVDDSTMVIDAAATWAVVEEAAQECFPALACLLKRFAGPQIKNAGTVGGHIAQGSLIGDALPLLCVMDAQVDIVSAEDGRTVPVSFFLDTDVALAAGEMISRVRLPLPCQGQTLRAEKVSRRQAFDRSVVSAALRVTCRDGAIMEDARVALGGIAPGVRRLPRTEAFLTGKPIDEDTLCRAGKILGDEIAPADDARGGAEYRRLLASNLLLRLLDDEGEAH